MKKLAIALIANIALILVLSGCVGGAPTGSPSRDDRQSVDEVSVDVLILVNKQHKLPDNYNPNLTTEGAPFNKVIVDDFTEMRAAALSENVILFIREAYRSYAEQAQIYEDEGPELAAPPGYSEHETGLAIDFSLADNSPETLKTYAWLAANAHNYGFILRYPEGKAHITGYDYEPWHYRYVGKTAAQEIYNRGLTLEEYLGVS